MAIELSPTLIRRLERMADLMCINCALQSATEPTVQVRKDGRVRCNVCANLAKEVEPPKPDHWGRHEVLDRAYLL